MKVLLHTDDCYLRWCWQDTATGICGHTDCKCPCHWLRRLRIRWHNALHPNCVVTSHREIP